MSDKSDEERQKGQAEAVDAFAAATAVGFAVASRTMEMWFGAMSGLARASREMLAPHFEAQLREADSDKPAAPVAPEQEVAAKAPPAGVVVFAPREKQKQTAPAKPKSEALVLEKRAPKPIERPSTTDDLKRIAGIGPKLELVLNGYGLWTYRQIADLHVEEIAWLDDLFGLNGRIAADKWLEQAEALGRAETDKRDVAAG